MSDSGLTGGLFYTVGGLLPISLFLDYFKLDVTEAERRYLKTFTKNELCIVGVSPFILLLATMAIKILSFSTDPPYGLLFFYFPLTIWYLPGSLTLSKSNEEDEDNVNAINYSIVSKTIVVGYFVCHFSMMLVLFGIFGPVPFEIVGNQWSDKPVVDNTFIVERNGELVPVYMNRGYLSDFMQMYAPGWLRFGVLSFISHLKLTATFRCLVFFLSVMFDSLTQAANVLLE